MGAPSGSPRLVALDAGPLSACYGIGRREVHVGATMINGLDSDLLLVGLCSVAAVADRALHGSAGMRRALLVAPLLFIAVLVLDLALALCTDFPHAVQTAIAMIGFLAYVAGGGALALALLDQVTRRKGSGGGRPTMGPHPTG